MICLEWARSHVEGGKSLAKKGLSSICLPYLTSDPKYGGSTVQWDPLGTPNLPYVPMYSKTILGGKLLAVGDEEGVVSILNTNSTLPKSLSQHRPNAQWVAHQNAIFDLQWLLGDEKMVTGSGDKSIGLWDTASAHMISSLRGHVGSVRTICASSRSPALLTSGGRDGRVMIWDTRCSELSHTHNNQVLLGPVHAFKEAHNAANLTAKRRRPSTKVPIMDSSTSVTSVLLLAQDSVIASAGAANGTVHLWDMRRLSQPASSLLPEKSSKRQNDKLGSFASCGESSGREHGIECLAVDHTGSRLLVSSHSAVHYMYDVLCPHLGPRRSFTGHTAESFYIRSCFSPDGSHFISGSSDGNAYIWEVDGRSDEPLILEGHSGEVSGAVWCSTDPSEVATCGDDSAVRIWKVNRAETSSPRLMRKAPKKNIRTPIQAGVSRLSVDSQQNQVEPSTAGPSMYTPQPQRPPLMPLPNAPSTSEAARASKVSSGKSLKQRSITAFLTPKPAAVPHVAMGTETAKIRPATGSRPNMQLSNTSSLNSPLKDSSLERSSTAAANQGLACEASGQISALGAKDNTRTPSLPQTKSSRLAREPEPLTKSIHKKQRVGGIPGGKRSSKPEIVEDKENMQAVVAGPSKTPCSLGNSLAFPRRHGTPCTDKAVPKLTFARVGKIDGMAISSSAAQTHSIQEKLHDGAMRTVDPLTTSNRQM